MSNACQTRVRALHLGRPSRCLTSLSPFTRGPAVTTQSLQLHNSLPIKPHRAMDWKSPPQWKRQHQYNHFGFGFSWKPTCFANYQHYVLKGIFLLLNIPGTRQFWDLCLHMKVLCQHRNQGGRTYKKHWNRLSQTCDLSQETPNRSRSQRQLFSGHHCAGQFWNIPDLEPTRPSLEKLAQNGCGHLAGGDKWTLTLLKNWGRGVKAILAT